jgi:tetratricopeptide (TPR) repeat protein
VIARPSLVVLGLAALGALAFVMVGPGVAPLPFGPPALGALAAAGTTLWLLRELRPRDRASIAGGAGALGFLIALASGVGPYPEALSFAAAWLPAYLLFLSGIGRERLAFELARLEEQSDDPVLRPRVLARAEAILRDAREAARELDPDAREVPLHPGDPRAVYAYAAQVTAYCRALDKDFPAAIAALGEVPPLWMPAPMRPLMLGNLAFWHLCAGAPEEALRALDALPEQQAPATSRAGLRVMRAAALVWQDKPAEGIALVGAAGDDAGEPAHLRARFAIVRAHALVHQGEHDAARGEVRRALDAPGGAEDIRKWLPAGGPARSLLEESLADKR